jgi:hypothetical protein
MGRPKKNITDICKVIFMDGEEIYVRKCPRCTKSIEYKGVSKRWNVQLAYRNNSVCIECQNIGQIPWNIGIPMSIEAKKKNSDIKLNKPVHSEEYKSWLKMNSIFTKVGEDSVVIKGILAKRNISYEQYLQDISTFKKYKNIVWIITKQQPIETLENSDRLRGLAGVDGAYQLDHMVSIREGYDNNIDPKEIGDIKNLQFIPWKENLNKSITYKKQKNGY